MTVPEPLRRAYERGRLARAAADSAPVCVLSLCCLLAGSPGVAQVALCCALPLTFGALRWRGQGWGRGAWLGLLAGLPALLAPLCLQATGHPCEGDACWRWSGAVCIGVGALAGALVGLWGRDRATALGALGVAALGAALGCVPLGIGVVGGAVFALGVSAAGVGAARRALA